MSRFLVTKIAVDILPLTQRCALLHAEAEQQRGPDVAVEESAEMTVTLSSSLSSG